MEVGVPVYFSTQKQNMLQGFYHLIGQASLPGRLDQN